MCINLMCYKSFDRKGDNMTDKDLNVVYGELISRCWEDEDFKKRFINETAEVLKEAGLPVEENVEYKVIEAEANENYVVLPDKNVAETVREITKLLLSVSEQTDIIVPEGSKIVVLQNTETLRYIVLKKAPEVLTEVELDMVAGGKGKNAAVNINIGAAVNVAAAATVTVAGAAINVAAAAVAVGAAGVVVVAGAVFI